MALDRQVPARGDRLIAIAAALPLAGVALWSLLHRKPVDFFHYYVHIHAARHRFDVYALGSEEYVRIAGALGLPPDLAAPFSYPPPALLLLLPFSFLGHGAAAALWQILNVAAFLAGMRRIARPPDRARAALLLAGFVPVWASLYAGQINGLVFYCMAAAMASGREGRDRAAGVWIALGAGLKVVPLVLLLPFVLRRRWAALASFALTALALFALATLFLGPGPVSSSLGHMEAYSGSTDSPPHPGNQTIASSLARLLTVSDWSPAILDAPELAGTLYVILLAPLLLLMLLTLHRLRAPESEVACPDLAFGILVAGVVLASPRAWYHHLAFLLLLAAPLDECRRRGRLSVAARAVLAGSYATISLYGVGWHALRGQALLQCAPAVATGAVLAVAGLLILRRPAR